MSRRLVYVAAPGVTHESTIAPGHGVCCTVAHINRVRPRAREINCSMPHIRRGAFVLALDNRFDSGTSTLLWQQYPDAHGSRDPFLVNNGARSPVRMRGFAGARLSLISDMPAVAAMPDPRPAMPSCLSAAPAARTHRPQRRLRARATLCALELRRRKRARIGGRHCASGAHPLAHDPA